ncbi:MAG: hypothetical protein WAW80_01485 [Candidatus Saccharimonadales bacterium]
MLDDIKSQIISSVSEQAAPQIGDFLDKLNSQIQIIVTVSIVVSSIWAILLLLNAYQRWKSHSAIMRMDKNLQILVEYQSQKDKDITLNTIDSAVEQ